MLAAVDFHVRSPLAFHFVPEKIPALQVAGAELVFGVLLIAGPHAGQPAFDLGAVGERIDDLADGHGLVGNCVLRIGHLYWTGSTMVAPFVPATLPGLVLPPICTVMG